MSLWRQLTGGLRVLVRRTSADQDLADELQDYLDRAITAHVARGLAPEAARRAAQLELGNATVVRERVRAGGWEHGVGIVAADARYAVRRLRAAPGFTTVAVVTLAIGIGGTTAIFSAVNPILFEPLPYPDAGRIVSVLELHPETAGARSDGTFAMFRQFADRSRTLESIAVMRAWQPTLTGADRPERLEGQRVSAGYFRVLGVPPAVGRDFEPSDDRFNGPHVVILSHNLWQRRFGGDAAVVGTEIALDDHLFTVIGIMPRGFENVAAPAAALWEPLQYDPQLPANGREWGHHLRTMARLAPGAGATQASQDVNALGRALIGDRHPDTYDPDTQFAAVPLRDELTRSVRPALLMILGAMTLVLAIACVNVTNLLLARGVQRRAEFALRAALGAGRGRLTRQLLTESLLLAAMGGAAGIVVAIGGVRALVALSPPGLPRAGAIAVNGAMFTFGVAVTTLVGLAFGVIPALQAARADPRDDLQHGWRQTGGHRRARGALVVSEVALALVLLVGSGLLLRSMERLLAVPIGFDARELLTMQVQVAGRRFDQAGSTYRFFDGALDAVRRVPGVTAAGFTSQLPLSGDRDEYGANFDATPARPAETYGVFRYAVSPGYLEAMRVPLRRGRLLDERDGDGAPLAAVISESLAGERFHGADPIGQRLRLGPAGPFTIVGVVGNVKQLSLAASDSNAVYINARQSWFADGVMSLAVRARGSVAARAPAIREAIWSVDRDQPVLRISTMDGLLAASAAERRFALVVFETFGLAALLLTTVGIYGVLSGSVTERTRELGVRSALGASRASIVTLVVGQGVALTALGVVIGIAGSLTASRAIVTLLFGVSRLDPLTYLGVTGLLAAAAAIACGVPAWRAARVDPAITLRAE